MAVNRFKQLGRFEQPRNRPGINSLHAQIASEEIIAISKLGRQAYQIEVQPTPAFSCDDS